jgi:hypothetical protein
MSSTTGTCAPCDDSPLSIASNVVGLFTFVVASVATYFTFLILTLGALEEIISLKTDLQSTSAQLIPLVRFCIAEEEQADKHPEIERCLNLLQESIRVIQDGAELALGEINALPAYNIRSRNPFDFQARRRFYWVQKRQSIVERAARISTRKTDILALQTAILLW